MEAKIYVISERVIASLPRPTQRLIVSHGPRLRRHGHRRWWRGPVPRQARTARYPGMPPSLPQVPESAIAQTCLLLILSIAVSSEFRSHYNSVTGEPTPPRADTEIDSLRCIAAQNPKSKFSECDAGNMRDSQDNHCEVIDARRYWVFAWALHPTLVVPAVGALAVSEQAVAGARMPGRM